MFYPNKKILISQSLVIIFSFLLIITTFLQYLYSQQKDIRLAINNGRILVPGYFDLNQSSFDLYIHLHGNFDVIEKNFLTEKMNGILLCLHLGSLSSPYRITFSNQKYLDSIIKLSLKILYDSISEFKSKDYSNLLISSFSAGYGGVREILKSEKYYHKIKSIILADGLHTDYILNENKKFINSEQMKDFLRFAKDATKFKKIFIISHSEIFPETYSSSTETADYLLDSTNTNRIFAELNWGNNFIQKSYAINGNLFVYGFYGNDGASHLAHLQNIGLFFRKLNLK